MQARILSWLAVQASNRLRFGDALALARRAVAAARDPATRPRSWPASTG